MSDRREQTSRKAYLLLLAPGSERSRTADYFGPLSSWPAQSGGQLLSLAAAPSVEHFGHNGMPQSVMLSAWGGLDALLAFWHSQEHRLPAARARGAEDLQAIALEGEPDTADPEAASIAIFLGPGPSPALLEAEGACALALVRERAVLRLRGDWDQGDVAIYAWQSATSARRPLMTFSSGQRGHGMLVPVLHRARPPAAAGTTQQRAAA